MIDASRSEEPPPSDRNEPDDHPIDETGPVSRNPGRDKAEDAPARRPPSATPDDVTESDEAKAIERDLLDLKDGRADASDDDGRSKAEPSTPDAPIAQEDARGNGDRNRTEVEPREGGDRDDAPGGGTDAKQPPPPLPSKWPFLIAGVLLVLLLAWSGYGHWRKHEDALQTRDDTVNAVVNVDTIEAKRNDRPRSLVLPGQTQAFDTANLYPRATGYVAQRLVDIGSRVQKGDLLIHIAAPDLDQQLAQAVAQLGQTEASLAQAQAQVGQAEANLGLAKVTFARTNQLTQQGYDTVQNHDNQQSNLTSQQAAVETAKAGVRVAESNIRSQQATVDRLKALASFEDIKAPFDGVITARSVDVGDLLNADSSSGAAIFRIDRDDTVRVSVYVPQSAAVDLHEGLDAKITVAQLPGRTFTGKVARSSVSLDASSRSLMAQIDVPNPDHVLRSGLYVLVAFDIPRDHPTVEVPAEALIFNQHGMQVATVENGSQVKIQPVKIDRDMGTAVELREGLKGGEQVVLSPPATLSPDVKVKATPRLQGDDENGQPGQPAKAKEAQADQKKASD